MPDLYYKGAQPRAVTARGDLAEDEKSTISLFKSVSPSVVFITTMAVRQDFFSLRALEVPQGAGSGFVWNENGYHRNKLPRHRGRPGGAGDAGGPVHVVGAARRGRAG